ncbi:putative sugar O-methyltransferase [Fontimonas sp. SYSU GA230001]|uniref:putative sugar O-methyltransferase n=1 Tax=Fontimonas sp. SYSU GA230001 TaxID=3142450 RepID=UPI0032B374C4
MIAKDIMPGRMRRFVQSALSRVGYRLVRLEADRQRYNSASFEASRPMPPGTEERLRADHPRLAELRRRYDASTLPMALHSMWNAGYLGRELDLRWFRGDNPYVWQFRNIGSDAWRKYYLYLRDIAARDSRNLLHTLTEDGLFGCWTFDYPGWPRVSRDLLDAINELYFLDRHLNLLTHPEWTVLDIGAGYGRLAHRATTAVPGLTWLCTDAVPESSFLCEFYLDFRQARSAKVVPLDELATELPKRRIDLAVNVHSFSEMNENAVRCWLDLLRQHQVPWLFIVPNDADRLLTMEQDQTRRPFDGLLDAAGYERIACEPVFADEAMREFMGVTDHFLLFRLRRS